MHMLHGVHCPSLHRRACSPRSWSPQLRRSLVSSRQVSGSLHAEKASIGRLHSRVTAFPSCSGRSAPARSRRACTRRPRRREPAAQRREPAAMRRASAAMRLRFEVCRRRRSAAMRRRFAPVACPRRRSVARPRRRFAPAAYRRRRSAAARRLRQASGVSAAGCPHTPAMHTPLRQSSSTLHEDASSAGMHAAAVATVNAEKNSFRMTRG